MALDDVKDSLKQGYAAHDKGQFPAAVAAFTSALETYEDVQLTDKALYAELHVARGKSLLRQGAGACRPWGWCIADPGCAGKGAETIADSNRALERVPDFAPVRGSI